MSSTQPVNARLRTLVRVSVDALTYAVALTAVSVVVAVVLGITTGGGIVRGKHLLFIFGWGMLAYATAKLWVKSGNEIRASAKNTQQRSGDEDSSDTDGPPDSMATASELRNRVTNDSSQRHSYSESLPERQDATRFQALVQYLPPKRWTREPRPEYRVGILGKILLTGVLVLAVSFVMETVFGIA